MSEPRFGLPFLDSQRLRSQTLTQTSLLSTLAYLLFFSHVLYDVEWGGGGGASWATAFF
jgi:hypothetical protein